MDGLQKGIENSMPSLKNTLGDVSWMIANGIDPQLQAGGNYDFASGGGFGTAPTTIINNTSNLTVNPSQGMSEENLARIAAERQEWLVRS